MNRRIMKHLPSKNRATDPYGRASFADDDIICRYNKFPKVYIHFAKLIPRPGPLPRRNEVILSCMTAQTKLR